MSKVSGSVKSGQMPKVTILQLDTYFPRPPGDVGCAATYDCTADIVTIAKASVAKVVSGAPGHLEIAGFEAAIAGSDADVIATSCGFLCYWQRHLAAHCSVPFISLALIDLPQIRRRYNDAELGILTFDADLLSGPAYAGCLGSFAGPIIGLPVDAHLRQVIAKDLSALDEDRAAGELCDLVADSLATYPLKALLLECTNLPPYKAKIKERFGVDIFDVLTAIDNRRHSLIRAEFL